VSVRWNAGSLLAQREEVESRCVRGPSKIDVIVRLQGVRWLFPGDQVCGQMRDLATSDCASAVGIQAQVEDGRVGELERYDECPE